MVCENPRAIMSCERIHFVDYSVVSVARDKIKAKKRKFNKAILKYKSIMPFCGKKAIKGDISV